jgi:hypothetical protein
VRERLEKAKPRKEVILPKLDLKTTGPRPTVTTPASPPSPNQKA